MIGQINAQLKPAISRVFFRLRELTMVDPSATEIISVVAAIGWATGAITGLEFSQMPAYAQMDALLKEPVWAGVFIVVSICQGLALMANSRQWRIPCAASACVLWFVLAGITSWDGYYGPAPFVYAVIGLANAWAVSQNMRGTLA